MKLITNNIMFIRLLRSIISALVFLFSLCYFLPALAQQKTYETKKVNSSPPVIDGVFDDEIWNSVEWE
ncbi:MAG: hypothetical protein K8R68_00550, partial [Bacteroidales bacterium]|nr:hypothetical protein [Bacteroidales bacterium]